MRVEVVLALPRAHRAVVVDVAAPASVADAVAASGLPLEGIDAYAVYGVRVAGDAPVRDGDRVELLRPLVVDPKDARRRRAARAAKG
ncbi:RnfH family protein [Luteimonas sp. MJ246]|uniref:RnfH family protein n=1 Tax=Luteimonas sp. MJ174 TaxID=3129237 RepID=UPI0031BBAE6C